jgi:hypothetical protein
VPPAAPQLLSRFNARSTNPGAVDLDKVLTGDLAG